MLAGGSAEAAAVGPAEPAACDKGGVVPGRIWRPAQV